MAANTALYVQSNTTATLVCNLANMRDYPGWSYGPSGATTYTRITWEGLKDFYQKQDRLSWADNKRDLLLSAVTREDESLYQCAQTAPGVEGNWQIQLTVRGKE